MPSHADSIGQDAEIRTLAFQRPLGGQKHPPLKLPEGFEASGLAGWQSHGGSSKAHPDRALPFSLEIAVPPALKRIHFVGVFALHAEPDSEPEGTVGACVLFLGDDGPVARVDLVNGIHYACGRNGHGREPGDGTSIQAVGPGVDLLTIDVPQGLAIQAVCFRDLGTPASFVIFDGFAEVRAEKTCPFHSRSGGVALGELGSILRIGDRVQFAAAIAQLGTALTNAEDLDEARGQALTFLAVVTAATIETGGGRGMHRVQLEASRHMEQATSVLEVVAVVQDWLVVVAPGMFANPSNPNDALMNRAMAMVDRNFATRLSDLDFARHLGLSTSHFRHLFRQATGQPFHRYVVAVRLEKARRMLLDQDASVATVAAAVGFSGISHFSRAFSQRFSISPTSARRASPV